MRRRRVVTLLALVALSAMPRAASANERLRVLVPDRDNLQYMSFWLAKAAGYFAEERLDIELLIPSFPQETQARFAQADQVDCGVLPPPVYVNLMASRVPVVLVANLLANDPIEIVVKKPIAAERKLSPDMPLRERLEGLRGLRIGVAPHPPTRLRALFTSQGLDFDSVASMVIVHGKEQNSAFREGRVDALFAHTPFVEQAIVQDDAMVLVNLSKGEAPLLANRQIHAFACQRAFVESEEGKSDRVGRAVRAIAKAQALMHRSPVETVSALANEFPGRPRRELETIVSLYEPAVPKSPEVKADRIPDSLTFFPAGMPKPDLSGIDLTKHVAPDIAVRVAQDASVRSLRFVWFVLGGLTFLGVASSLLFRGYSNGSRRRRPENLG